MTIRFVLASLCLVGCVGEAAVSYQGSVVEGAENHVEFGAAPAAGTPVADARVELCVAGRCIADQTAADGTFPELEQVFGGFVGKDTEVIVRVTAGDRIVGYETTYEHTDDPTVANPSCDPACPPVFLNFTMGP